MQKKLVLGIFVVLLFAVPARAQDEYPRGEIFVGYSYGRTDLSTTHDNTHGWEASLAGYPRRNFGLEADFSAHYGSIRGVDYRDYLFLFGPRVAWRRERLTPWVHALFGLSHFRALGASTNDLAVAVGGGLDLSLNRRVAIRLGQADYVFVNFNSPALSLVRDSHSLRLSFGVVLKWGE